MNIDDLTIGQFKQLSTLISFGDDNENKPTLNKIIGEKVIVRTYSAGVWFGKLSEKSGNEVILTNARRMYKWWAAESISLSAVSIHGIKQKESKICEAVHSVWLEAIEIIPCEQKAIFSLEEAKNVKAE